MLDLRAIRRDPEPVRAALARRKDGSDERLGRVLELDERARALRTEVESLQAERNSVSAAIGQAKKAGEDASEAELWDALRVAQADGFVTEMDGGLEAEIAQGGTNVSGGQRQRLAIARALAHRPRIYLFDDSFSALDLSTDARLRQALWDELPEVTKIVVAQRVSTITGADRIVVLEDGRMVGLGTHEELLATSATYREIVESQLGVEA